ncbi:hypothetical protein RFI_31495 [Reticulomyxa filosa]|uniref:Uncharacterized protein n=1 Tax=Reticulomyxa filosa TaxID=46433 RepID=X6LX48_RETFI|nr:hypothetical protein RFI_31495 [Reticulomyxa filosa]|eukprot:ETO05901.1 hypothetical protein RFI_31495 [Reticulomyxa filosa]
MKAGKTVILSSLECIYDRNVYCRVALGNESRDCYVHENFKCVVIVQKQEAHSPKYANAYIYKSKYYEKIAFLSRFEKQLISYRDSLPKHLKPYIDNAANILSRYFARRSLDEVFCGYCDDTVPSALLYLRIQKAMKTEEKKDDEKKEPMQTKNIILDDVQFDREELRSQLLDLLLPLCRPEAVVQMRINEDIKFCSLVSLHIFKNISHHDLFCQHKKKRENL